MAIRIDWKSSLIMTVILIAILYSLRFIIDDYETRCLASIIIVVVVFAAGNLLLRRR
ncbi:MAG: hypothetical protein JSW28_01015 [Thermoplasmata archaeon]|nr:MAG: hypothetical protein JSW28_01015 [Thermoplasmata archaeon]